MEPLSHGDFIGRWMSQIEPAARGLGERKPGDDESYRQRLEFASVELSLANLMTFPMVQSRVESGELHLHGAYFGVASGRLLVRSAATGRFEPVDDGKASPLAMIRCDDEG
jgi:carbonic anhydrase